MKWAEYKTRVPGKWVLAGEHTVLRGGVAVAFPHPEFALDFSYTPDSKANGGALTIEPDLASPVIHDLIRLAQKTFSQEFSFPSGRISIESTIPFGAGLGSSAALSVALSRWLLTSRYGSYADQQVIELARVMEDKFHGKSSGMDVSVAALGRPIRFSMREGARILDIPRMPKFQFTDTGLRASTRECIEKVEACRTTQKEAAELQDLEMRLATDEVLKGLSLYGSDPTEGLKLLKSGMERSKKVFDHWGLNPEQVQTITQRIQEEGALAARLTGAGSGGFVVSLWSDA